METLACNMGFHGNCLISEPKLLQWQFDVLSSTSKLQATSLFPMLFSPPSPVFDRLLYANMEEEGLGDLVTCDYIR